MTELLTAAQMRAIEQAAIDSGQVTGLELMERAGQGVVDAIFEEWPELRDRGSSPSPSVAQTDGANENARSPRYLGPDEGDPLRAVVLCGPGNNGGDGFVVARLLRELGWEVEVFLYGDPEKLPPDARVNYERWSAAGRDTVQDFNEIEFISDEARLNLLGADLVIDALFGTGLSRPLGNLHNAIWQTFDLDGGPISRLVAVDIPSGFCSDSGRILSEEGTQTATRGGDIPCHALDAKLTVTFHRAKVGHMLSSAARACGKLVIKDIGLPVRCARWDVELTTVSETADYLLDKSRAANKFAHGHAFVLSGPSGKTGAARLAARGALRVGAGLVTLGAPQDAQIEVASQVTAIMLKTVDGGRDLAEALKDDRLNALCLGPGLGFDLSRDLVPVALTHDRKTVLDADALSAFADKPAYLFGMLHEKCVLTPHGGEFARLFPDIVEKLNAEPIKGPAYSKVDATREAAKRAGCVVLFKGPDTVIADPNGRCSINRAHYDRSAPWLATAGSGDVLAGFITGLLARGFNSMQAAETAAWLHVECARQFGPGLIAEDLPEQLPHVFKQMNI